MSLCSEPINTLAFGPDSRESRPSLNPNLRWSLEQGCYIPREGRFMESHVRTNGLSIMQSQDLICSPQIINRIASEDIEEKSLLERKTILVRIVRVIGMCYLESW